MRFGLLTSFVSGTIATTDRAFREYIAGMEMSGVLPVAYIDEDLIMEDDTFQVNTRTTPPTNAGASPSSWYSQSSRDSTNQAAAVDSITLTNVLDSIEEDSAESDDDDRPPTAWYSQSSRDLERKWHEDRAARKAAKRQTAPTSNGVIGWVRSVIGKRSREEATSSAITPIVPKLARSLTISSNQDESRGPQGGMRGPTSWYSQSSRDLERKWREEMDSKSADIIHPVSASRGPAP